MWSLFNWKLWLVVFIVVLVIMWILWGGKTIPLTTEDFDLLGLTSNRSQAQNVSDSVPSSWHNSNFSEGRKSHTDSIPPLPKIKESRWLGEALTCLAMEHIIGEKVARSVRPFFLKNPRTGRNLELDCYSFSRKLAVEYNGRQHYQYPNTYHINEQQFAEQVSRDRMKHDLCDKNGVYLIHVPYTIDTNQKTKEGRWRAIYKHLYNKINEIYDPNS